MSLLGGFVTRAICVVLTVAADLYLRILLCSRLDHHVPVALITVDISRLCIISISLHSANCSFANIDAAVRSCPGRASDWSIPRRSYCRHEILVRYLYHSVLDDLHLFLVVIGRTLAQSVGFNEKLFNVLAFDVHRVAGHVHTGIQCIVE